MGSANLHHTFDSELLLIHGANRAEVLKLAETLLARIRGGGLRLQDLAFSLSRSPGAVAADCGAYRLLAAGVMPGAVICDFDSVSEAALKATQRPSGLIATAVGRSSIFNRFANR